MRVIDWSREPILMRYIRVAAALDIHPRTLYQRVQRGDRSVPQPAYLRPMRWRREDVQQHIETHSIVQQRADLVRAALKVA
jgi:predicted DNA-binding transcriptional regulator AlpA